MYIRPLRETKGLARIKIWIQGATPSGFFHEPAMNHTSLLRYAILAPWYRQNLLSLAGFWPPFRYCNNASTVLEVVSRFGSFCRKVLLERRTRKDLVTGLYVHRYKSFSYVQHTAQRSGQPQSPCRVQEHSGYV
jgi:hypothetical protein